MKKNNSSERALIPVREASSYLGVHANTLRRWSEEGFIKAYRIGPAGHRRFKLADIKALLD